MTTEHTPGPWGCTYTSNHAHDYRLTRPDGSPLRLHVEANDHSEQRATAALIGAAPDLLAALQLLVDRAARLDQSATHDGLMNCDALAGARAAIRKATGALS